MDSSVNNNEATCEQMAPRTSVLIATYNRAAVLRDTLEAMLGLDVPSGGFELIVIDNNSPDNTKEVCESYKGKLPLHYLFEPRQGKNCALNAGLAIAKGQFLVFTDDDVSPFPDWLCELVRAAERFSDTLVFGGPFFEQCVGSVPSFVLEAVMGTFYLGSYEPRPDTGPYPPRHSPPGVNLAIRRKVFRELAYRYNESIGPRGDGRISGSESELLLRLNKDGISMIHVASAKVYHRWYPHQFEYRLLIRKAFGFGRGDARLYGPDSHIASVFGVPRYLIRKAVVEFFKGVAATVSLNKIGSMYSALRLARFMGIAYESFKQRKSATQPPSRDLRQHR